MAFPITWLYVSFQFVLGIMIGSFVNVCIYRIPINKSVCKPRSHCPQCGKLIRWYDNIPLISYIYLRRKCRYCSAPISIQYPLVEAVTGIAFTAIGCRFPLEPVSILYLYVTFALIAISGIDWYHRIIPDFFSYSLLILGLIFSPLNPALGGDWQARILGSVFGAITGFAILYLIAFIGELIMKQEVMGGGDIKLLCGIGAVLGWAKVLSTLFIASLAGSLAGICLLAFGKMRRRDYLPFGPFIAIAAYINIFLPDPWMVLTQIDITRISVIRIFLDKLI